MSDVTSYVEVAKNAYKSSVRFSATLVRANIYEDLKVSSVWSWDSLAASRKVAVARSHQVIGNVAYDCGSVALQADEVLHAVTKDLDVSVVKYDKKEEVMHIFKSGILWKEFNLTELDLHGSVYNDEELGGLAINENGSKIAFIAEKKEPKAKPFFKTTNAGEANKVKGNPGLADTDEGKEDIGQEFRYKPTFGEQLAGKHQSVVVTLDLISDKFDVLDTDVFPEGHHPGQVTFYGDDTLIGITVDMSAIYLGLVYCSNRPSVIFSLDVQEPKTTFKVLTKKSSVGSMSPRVMDNMLIWLERDLGTDSNNYPGPHQNYFRVMKLNLNDQEAQPAVILSDMPDGDRIRYQDSKTDDTKFSEYNFRGICTQKLPRRCLMKTSTGSTVLVAHELIDDTFFPYALDLDSTNVTVWRDLPMMSVVDVSTNIVLVTRSNPLSPVQLGLIFLKCDMSKNLVTLPGPKHEDSSSLSRSLKYEAFKLKPLAVHPNEKYKSVDFSAIYVGPSGSNCPKASVPVILNPHGGPHSAISTSFMPEVLFFNILGYAVIRVNYRGSVGAGKDSVESLLGHVGDLDVKDCNQALKEALTRYPHLDPSRVHLWGGSHGGFLVTHLASQYPGTYKSVASRNGVLNLASMAGVTDIPDWVSVEGGWPCPPGRSSGSESLRSFYNRSPIAQASKLEAPVLLLVGSEDLRVPKFQSIEYFHHLKSLGKDVRMNIYEDCHPLKELNVQANVMVNMALFFKEVEEKVQ